MTSLAARLDAWCQICGSNNPLRRGMMHRRGCFAEQAWDIEGACTCKAHQIIHDKEARIDKRDEQIEWNVTKSLASSSVPAA